MFSDYLQIKNKLYRIKISSEKDKPTDFLKKLISEYKLIKEIAIKYENYINNEGKEVLSHLDQAYDAFNRDMNEAKSHIRQAIDIQNKGEVGDYFR